jgi:hypothetical protein
MSRGVTKTGVKSKGHYNILFDNLEDSQTSNGLGILNHTARSHNYNAPRNHQNLGHEVTTSV